MGGVVMWFGTTPHDEIQYDGIHSSIRIPIQVLQDEEEKEGRIRR